jgi:hypothetical protein
MAGQALGNFLQKAVAIPHRQRPRGGQHDVHLAVGRPFIHAKEGGGIQASSKGAS